MCYYATYYLPPLMNKLLISIMLITISLSGFAQRFAQYNTGTLYDSFENPSQAAFIPDSSRQFAINVIPNFNANLYVKGNAQYTLKSRLFLGRYNNDAFTVGQNNYNNALVNANVYVGMIRMFTSLSGKQEVGLSYQIKGSGRGHVTDETVSLFSGLDEFKQGQNSNVFNNKAFYEAYHQFSINYREKVTRNFSVGAKLSLLSGIGYNNLDIQESNLNVNQAANTASWRLRGVFQSTYRLGEFRKRDLLPTFQHPGAAVSLGATYIAPGGIILQGNLKDLGFIRWGANALTYNFNRANTITGRTPAEFERNVENALTNIIETRPSAGAFYKPIVGRAEFSAAKKFQLGSIGYLPTLIVSKQVYGFGTAGAWVNQIQFDNLSTSLSGILNEDKLFDLGLQFMYKSPNFDFFVGSEQLTRSFNLLSASKENEDAITKSMSHSGGSLYLGFSFKFGKRIERWKNDSYYYNGSEQGPLGRAWNKAFNK